DPVSTGIAASSPNCVSFRPSSSLIGMPTTANIIQTAKHTVNASVLPVSTDQCLLIAHSAESSSALYKPRSRGCLIYVNPYGKWAKRARHALPPWPEPAARPAHYNRT